MVMVEPSFLAPTTTPSMRPSFCELTCPLRATGSTLFPLAESGAKKNMENAINGTIIVRKVFFSIRAPLRVRLETVGKLQISAGNPDLPALGNIYQCAKGGSSAEPVVAIEDPAVFAGQLGESEINLAL